MDVNLKTETGSEKKNHSKRSWDVTKATLQPEVDESNEKWHGGQEMKRRAKHDGDEREGERRR